MQECWSFTCCSSCTLSSSSKCSQLPFFIGITLVDVLLNWLHWFQFFFLEGGLLVILIDCMIDVTIPGCYKDVYVIGFNSGIKTPFSCRFFLKRFLVIFNLFVLLSLVTPCLAVAAEPYMEWIPIKKIILILDAINSTYIELICVCKWFFYWS